MKNIYIALIAAVGLLVTAQAALIDLGTTSKTPANPQAELDRLNGIIDTYYTPGLVKPDESWNIRTTTSPDDDNVITLNLLGFDGYVMMRWGETDRFYYINDLDQPTTDLSSVSYLGVGLYEFQSDVYAPPRVNGTVWDVGPPVGLSHYTAFSVPEPATFAVTLLGVAFGVGHLARRKLTR